MKKKNDMLIMNDEYLTEAQLKQIRAMIEAGDQAGAKAYLNSIMDKMSRKTPYATLPGTKKKK